MHEYTDCDFHYYGGKLLKMMKKLELDLVLLEQPLYR
jgi:hypothetical protein